MSLISSLLLSVSLQTADSLSYLMLVLVGVFLVFGPFITWYFWKQSRKLNTTSHAASE